MIELAPRHKAGLTLQSPIMPAAGHAGFSNEHTRLIDWSRWGAFVSSPITLRPQKPDTDPLVIDLDTALLIEDRLPNPGIRSVIKESRETWKHLGVPIIAHIVGTTPDDVAECVVRLAILDGIAGIELGFRDSEDEGAIAAFVAASVEIETPPVMVRLPLARASRLAPICIEAGADALVVAAPPVGTLLSNGEFVSGQVYSRGMLPLVMRAVRETLERVDAPVIASGGVHTLEDARALLAAGAKAVQIDTLLWRDPNAAMSIAKDFTDKR